MDFGLFIEFAIHDDFTHAQAFQEAFALVDAAEAMGVESLWLAEYHFQPDRSVLSSPVTVGSAIAARTQNIKIGLAVYVLPLSNPIRIAEEVATLDHISGGRLDFGIGRSAFPRVYIGYGMAYEESRDRFSECLDVILKAWTMDRFSFQGEYYSFEDVCVIPKPLQKPLPPIRIGATSVETFSLIGRMGYPIFINPSRGSSLLDLAPHIQEFRSARKASGYDSKVDVGLRLPVYVAETVERAYSEPEESTMYGIRRLAGAVAGTTTQSGIHDDRSVQAERLTGMSYEDVLRNMVVYGTPEMVVERLQELQEELGLTQIIYEVNLGCRIPHELQLNCIRLFNERVVPHLS